GRRYNATRVFFFNTDMAIKILSPLNSVSEAEPLALAGADEFYCGVLPDDWKKKYSVAASLNRRQEDNPEIGTTAHLKSFGDFEETIRIAHSHKVKVSLTLNEHYYSNPQYPYLIRYIEKALKAGADAFIAGDIAIILAIREIDPKVKIHISTAGTAFNSETVHFYRDLGASRVILPRHLSLEEVGDIARAVSGIELETFILNSRCANVDGFCTFQHGLAEFIPEKERKRNFENACMMLYKITASVRGCSPEEGELLLQEKVSWERQHFWSAVHIDDRPCGVCALYEFEKMGLAGVKIVGRQNKPEKKIKDVAFIRKALCFLRDDKPDKKAFRQFARRLYKEQYDSPCLIFKCYYPSVLLDETETGRGEA
ncbi:MAG: U32 family peptidase, partial [Pseudomonadota bacterium]